MSTTGLEIVGDTVLVPAQFAGAEDAFRVGYRAGREVQGRYRLNIEAMRYEPLDAISDMELEAWTEGFRIGYVARRAAGEPLRY
jgi:hypothetical protein